MTEEIDDDRFTRIGDEIGVVVKKHLGEGQVCMAIMSDDDGYGIASDMDRGEILKLLLMVARELLNKPDVDISELDFNDFFKSHVC